MAHLPYAFSIHHFISTVGADAGFASIVGLAVLVLLFFAQARETTTLREQLADAGERVAALEARLSQALRSGTGAASPAQPAPAPPMAQAAGATSPGSASMAPATASPARVGAGAVPAAIGASASRTAAPGSPPAPAAGGAPPGVGAPAQGAATRLIPDVTTVQPPVTAAATAAGAAAAGAAGAAAAGGAGAGPASAAAAGSGTRTPTPAPAPAPVAANGSASPPAGPPPRIQIRPGAGAASTARRPPAGPHLASTGRVGPTPRARRVLAAVLALGAIAAAVIVLLLVTSSGGSSSKTATTTTSASNAPVRPSHHHRRATSAVVPASVTVAVLNGTATNGLAHRVAVKLTGGGFKQGNITTAVDQTRTATTVAYLPGQRKAALAVAGALNLGSASVAPADQTTRTVACQGLSPAACSAQTVIVTVGSDLATIH